MSLVKSGRNALAGIALAFTLAVPAHAQTYPSKPISLIVAFGVGGPTDIFARLLADGMREQLGQNVLVENRTGAGGGIGAQAVIDAKPDGYTLGVMTTGISALPVVYKAFSSMNLVGSFTPISNLIYSPIVAVVNSSFPAKDLKEFIAAVKGNPGKYNFGIGGSSSEMDANLLLNTAGMKMNVIAYRGSAPAMVAVAADEIQVTLDVPNSAKPLVDGGKARIIGVLSDKPWPVMPNLQLVTDLVPGYKGAVPGWWGLNGPKGLPKDIVDKLANASRVAMRKPDVRKRLEDMSMYVSEGTGEDLDRVTTQSLETYKKGAALMKFEPQ